MSKESYVRSSGAEPRAAMAAAALAPLVDATWRFGKAGA
jgi:hypothetical protein